MKIHPVRTASGTVIHNPPIARFLFDDTRMAPIWLVIRVLLGWQWLASGVNKLRNPAWMQTGEALQGFWMNAIGTGGETEVKYDWYRSFLQGLLDSGSYTWFAKVVAFGETAVGIALIIGAFVGVAAFMAGFMNWNYIMAGAASSNGLFFAAAVLLILAWKTAGYLGLDRYLFRAFGTPWTPDRKAQEQEAQESSISYTPRTT
jgi:thiosulfate dehydrogenase [quinone] large subunit